MTPPQRNTFGQRPVICPTCGLLNPPRAKFCTHCGNKLSATPPAPHQIPVAAASSAHQQSVAPTNVSHQPAPTRPMGFPENIAEFWWVHIPVFLRRYSMLLAEAWQDGIYITARPFASIAAPAIIFLFGFLQGAFHWDFGIHSSYAGNISFTGSLPLLLLAAVIGAFSAQLGLMLVLGYGIGDFFIAGPQVSVGSLGALPANPFTEFIFLRIPLLVTYFLFFLLAVISTLTAKFLVLGLHPLLRRSQAPIVSLRITLNALLQGAMVYAWALAVPLYIRILWGWSDSLPPLSATYYPQSLKNLIIAVAVIAVIIRGILAYPLERASRVAQRTERLVRGLRNADTHPAFTRRLPFFVRALLLAAGITLLFSGFIGSIVEASIVFIFLALILLARMVWLPHLALWSAWTNLITHVPLLLCLLIGIVVSNVLGLLLLSTLSNLHTISNTASGSFLPLLIGICLSLLVFMILVPQATLSSVRSPTMGRQQPEPGTHSST